MGNKIQKGARYKTQGIKYKLQVTRCKFFATNVSPFALVSVLTYQPYFRFVSFREDTNRGGGHEPMRIFVS